MTALPDGWATATLDELAAAGGITDGPFGSNLKTEHYTEDGPRVVRLQNIGDGVFRDERAHISDDHFQRLQKHSVQANDVLVASLGEVLPRACRAPASLGPAIVKADCIRVRPAEDVSSAYLAWALNAPQTRAQVGESIKGVGRPRINLSDLRALRLPVPPAAEQERVVVAIEEAFSKLDAGESGLRRARQLIKRMRAAVVDVALTGRLDLDARDISAASGWDRIELGDLVENDRRIAYGVLQPGGDVPTGVPMVRVMDLERGMVGVDQLKRIDPEIAASFPRTTLRGSEVLLSVVGTIGRVAIVPQALAGANVARAVAVLPLDQARVEPGWAALVLSHEPNRRVLERTAHEVARKTLNLEDVRAFQLHVPPLDVQRRILAEVNRQFSFLDACEAAVDASFVRSAALRRSVLKSAFEGQLAPQDPTDEPASALLERIQTARPASKPARRARATA